MFNDINLTLISDVDQDGKVTKHKKTQHTREPRSARKITGGLLYLDLYVLGDDALIS